MGFDIGRAIGQGIERSLSTTGLVVGLLFFVIHSASTVLSRTPYLFESTIRAGDQTTFGMIAGGILFGFLVLMVASIVVQLGAARLLARPISELDSIDRDAFTDRLLFGGGSLLLAIIVSGVATGIGFVLFVVPGIFLAVSFAFFSFTVAVEDRGPIDGLERSWEIASGNRWSLFGLGLLGGVVSFALAIPVGFLAMLPGVGIFIDGAFNAAVQTVSLAILAEIYTTLAGGNYDPEPDDAPWE